MECAVCKVFKPDEEFPSAIAHAGGAPLHWCLRCSLEDPEEIYDDLRDFDAGLLEAELAANLCPGHRSPGHSRHSLRSLPRSAPNPSCLKSDVHANDMWGVWKDSYRATFSGRKNGAALQRKTSLGPFYTSTQTKIKAL